MDFRTWQLRTFSKDLKGQKPTHNPLINKSVMVYSESYGICGIILQHFETILEYRRQFVKSK